VVHAAHWVTVQHLGLKAVRSLGSCGSLIFSCVLLEWRLKANVSKSGSCLC
jgi:hypothetical protein